jgi:hypothetical protein
VSNDLRMSHGSSKATPSLREAARSHQPPEQLSHPRDVQTSNSNLTHSTTTSRSAVAPATIFTGSSLPCPRAAACQYCSVWELIPNSAATFCPLVPFRVARLAYSTTAFLSSSGYRLRPPERARRNRFFSPSPSTPRPSLVACPPSLRRSARSSAHPPIHSITGFMASVRHNVAGASLLRLRQRQLARPPKQVSHP